MSERVATPQEALAFVRRHKVVTLTATEGVPSMVVAVSGEPIRGSWWGHESGKRIFECSTALAASGEVLDVRLVAGKVTFVHRILWSAFYRVVTDRGWRASAKERLRAGGKSLLAEIERAGEVRLDALRFADRAALKKAKEEVEKSLLAFSEQLHTERGSHTTVFRTWERWATPEVQAAARALGLEEAKDALRAACGAAPNAIS
jgi:hypothetical protein